MFPGLAVAAALRSRGHEVAVVLSGRSVEATGAKNALPEGVETLYVPSRPLSARHPLSLLAMGVSVIRALRVFRKYRPEALVAMGSYTSFAPVVAARMLSIPTVLHEANAIPGKAIERLAKACKPRAVCLGFPEAKQYLPHGQRVVDTGLPLRTEFLPGIGSSKAEADHFSLLVMGGSQGAASVNQAVVGAIAALRTVDPRLFAKLRVTHLTGTANEATVRGMYQAAGLEMGEGSPFTVLGFSAEMPRHYAEANFCISRAGASSCFELALAGLPALFIPLPKLARNHQVFNARSMQQRGAGLMMEQADLTAEGLARMISEIAADEPKRASLRKKLLDAARNDAAIRVALAVEETLA